MVRPHHGDGAERTTRYSVAVTPQTPRQPPAGDLTTIGPMMSSIPDALELEGAITARLEPGGDIATFGRSDSCTWIIGPDDRGVSRLQGGFEHIRGEWWIRNFSITRPMALVLDTGLGEAIPVESSRIVDRRTLTVIVTGEVQRHPIFVRRPAAAGSGAPAPFIPAAGADQTSVPLFTARERWALIALVEGYLMPPPRHSPQPRSYQQIADRLGLPRSTVMKRIENVRKKLYTSGVPGMDAPDARMALSEYLLASRTVDVDDLDRLAHAIVAGEVS